MHRALCHDVVVYSSFAATRFSIVYGMLIISIKLNEKVFEQFMQHRCHTINQDVSTRGSLSAEQLKNEGEGANKY